MIYVYDPTCVEFQHVEVNTFLINALSKSLDDEICFFSEEKHGRYVKERLDKENVDITYKIRDVDGDTNKYQRFLHIYRHYKQLIDEAQEKHVKAILITVARKYEVVIMNILANRYDGSIYLQFHAHLSIVMGSKFYRSIIFNHTANNIKYIVLSRSIKNSMLGVAPQLQDKIVAIHHVLPSDGILENHLVNSGHIKFGFIGIATPEKGMESICNIVGSIKDKNAEFYYCGVIHEEFVLKQLKDAGINIRSGTTPLSFEEYKEAIRSLDYVVLLLEQAAYEYRVSGTLIDAVNNERPVIVLSNNYSDEVFEEFGKIGYLCDNEDEIVKQIQYICSSFNQKEYNKQVEAMRRMKCSMTVETVAEELLQLQKQ